MAYQVNYATPTKQEVGRSDRGIKPFEKPKFEQYSNEEWASSRFEPSAKYQTPPDRISSERNRWNNQEISEELPNKLKSLQNKDKLYQDKASQRDNWHRQNQHIHERKEIKQVDEKQRDSRLLRNNSEIRINNSQQANFIDIVTSAMAPNRQIARTPTRINSLEDVYKTKKVEKVSVPISSKFMNLPTNMRHK